MSRTAIVLFNLGGPNSLDAVRPFLFNLFNDPAIIRVPALLRSMLAAWIAHRRAPVAREIYGKMGNRSPILPNTEAQARALEQMLGARCEGLHRHALLASDDGGDDEGGEGLCA